jgi:hypothetical protein
VNNSSTTNAANRVRPDSVIVAAVARSGVNDRAHYHRREQPGTELHDPIRDGVT